MYVTSMCIPKSYDYRNQEYSSSDKNFCVLEFALIFRSGTHSVSWGYHFRSVLSEQKFISLINKEAPICI